MSTNSENIDPSTSLNMNNKPKTKLPMPTATKLPTRRGLEDRTNDINQMPPPPAPAPGRGRSRAALAGSRSNSTSLPSSVSRSTSREGSTSRTGGRSVNASSFLAPKSNHKRANSTTSTTISSRIHEEAKAAASIEDLGTRMQHIEEIMQRDSGEKEELLCAEIRRLKTEASKVEKLKEELDDVRSTLEMERENSYQLYNERTQRILEERDNRISHLEKTLSETKDEFINVTSDLKLKLAEKPLEIRQQLYEEFEQERANIRRAAEEEVVARHQREIESLESKHQAEMSNLGTRLQTEHDAEFKRLYNDCERQFNELRDKLYTEHNSEMSRLKEAADEKVCELEATISKLKTSKEEEIQQLNLQFSQERSRTSQEYEKLMREKKSLLTEVEDYKEKLDEQKHETESLRATLSELSASSVSYESINKSQQDQINELHYQLQVQKDKVSELKTLTQEAQEERDACKDKLLKEEFIRRKLHNQIQELKGNIRVFCRVRPKLQSDAYPTAEIQYPDKEMEGQQILLSGPSSDSTLTSSAPKLYQFNFDRVFSPDSTNDQVFDEISQLVQSALDGYNVCIFAYGQTGSGKTYTMSSPKNGMISRAISQIFQTADALKDKGWKYELEGQFLEIYNENLNDLLGKPDQMDKSKLDIRHDDTKMKTTVTNLTTVTLDSPEKVEFVLKRAWDNRSVAATKVNERSSRSHSVFILKLMGENTVTGDKSEGVLNLIDLAGSERLSQSQAAGERLKETQAINKSLSSLGDVIQALGGSKDHVPYRNSKVSLFLFCTCPKANNFF